MTNTQKKSLDHVSKMLKSFDTSSTYSALKNVLSILNVLDANKILSVYQDEIYKQNKIIQEAKEWIDIVISDIK